VLRSSIFAATVLLVGCPSKQPQAPHTAVDDAALRIRIAHAEARRAGGVAELSQLAASGDTRARELALRGLGRIGTPPAIAALEAALADREPRVVTAAATALGVAAALHEDAKIDGAKLVPLLARADVRYAAAEALGRGGAPGEQAALRGCITHPSCVLALGRYGRRKIALEPATRDALATLGTYEATYTLAREHEPGELPRALVTALASPDAETRAQAIVGIVKHEGVAATRAQLVSMLGDVDWRVAVEAGAGLATDEAGRSTLPGWLAGRDPHVVHEALRAMIDKPLDETASAALAPLVKERGWTGCLAARALGGPTVVDAVVRCALPDHLRLPLLADVGDPAARRAALRVLLAHDDPRVRSSGLSALAATWGDADTRTRETIVTTLTSALAVRDPIVAGSAVDAISAVLDAGPNDALGAAIVARATVETEVELSVSLYGVIEKHALTAGLDACRTGLTGHPSRVHAAAACVRALGEAPVESADAVAEPPVDLAAVVGHQVTWYLKTNKGEIVIELRPDVAPWAVASIVALTQKRFYDGLELHRVVPDFVAQGGDPTQSGWGGPGYALPAEPSGDADGPGFVTGGIGMADSGPDSAGSQWFIMHSRAAHLDGRYTWVGSVTAGQPNADTLVIGDVVQSATVEIR